MPDSRAKRSRESRPVLVSCRQIDGVVGSSRGGDDVIPFADSEELARRSGETLIEVGNGHRLADPEPLAAMLKACEGPS